MGVAIAKQITGGTVEGIITVGYVLMNLNSELCTVLKSIDYKCPLAAKDYTVSQSFAISEIVELRVSFKLQAHIQKFD